MGRARPAGGRQQRRVERGAAGDDERGGSRLTATERLSSVAIARTTVSLPDHRMGRAARRPIGRCASRRIARGMIEAGGGSSSPIAPATNASARPVTPPPHGFSRGCDGIEDRDAGAASRQVVSGPRAGGPAPTMATSVERTVGFRLLSDSRLQAPRLRAGQEHAQSSDGPKPEAQSRPTYRDTLHAHGRTSKRDDSRLACFRTSRGRRRGLPRSNRRVSSRSR